MPQLVKKRRSGWAVLATGALVASLLAVGASPASAQTTDKADNSTKLSACVGDALGDQMFTDVSDGHAFGDAINCIAYYGITNGTGDGSTYSPNQEVTRAEMAVFIARAAEAAGVDLGDAMSAGFTDIGGVWQEAQDAINRLASKGVISSGGAYRPDDAITRAEMASFLIGMLNKAAPNVTITSSGIQLGDTGSTTDASDWDYFADARNSVPAANDAEISAIYELGITKGASPAAGATEGEAPLDFNYEPAGTVNRGQMAAFITRALAHTSVRPAGISAQVDVTDVVVSARDADFQPDPGVVADVFYTDTNGVELAFRANGTCAEVSPFTGFGTRPCEIESSDLVTGGDGDARVGLSTATITGYPLAGGTTVWAWTGDVGDTVDSDTDPFRLDIPEDAAPQPGTRVRITSEHPAGLASTAPGTTGTTGGKKAHLGSTVLYTVQLEDDNGNPTTVGIDGKSPAKYRVSVSTALIVGGTAQTALSLTPIPLTTDADGKATFAIPSPPDQTPGTSADKWQVAITIAAANPTDGITPLTTGTSTLYLGGRTAAESAGDVRTLVFSTAARATQNSDITVSVTPALRHAAADARGASNRATVSVTDVYGDPITGVKVTLTSNAGASTSLPAAGAARQFTVGRDGSYTFGWAYSVANAAAEQLTGTLVDWDHDGDGGATTAALTASSQVTVEWAARAVENQTDEAIVAFDKDTNTIFAGTSGTVWVINYDSNDRFDVGAAGSEARSSYSVFEKSLANGLALDWVIDLTRTGSRRINTFTLSTS